MSDKTEPPNEQNSRKMLKLWSFNHDNDWRFNCLISRLFPSTNTHRCKGLTGVTRESDTSFASGPFASALKRYCIPGSSGPHSCPHTLALFNTGLHSLNSKLNPPSGLLGMTDMVNIVESVCQDPGRPALPEQETHSQNIVLGVEMRPGTAIVRDGDTRSVYGVNKTWSHIHFFMNLVIGRLVFPDQERHIPGQAMQLRGKWTWNTRGT